MSLEETPWDDSHHRSSFFLKPETIDTHPDTLVLPGILTNSHHDVLSEGNLGNIYATIPIDISVKLGIVENIHIGASCSPDEIQTYTTLFKEFCDIFAWSYEEIPGIDLNIIIHEIKTYPEAKLVQQKLHPVHP
jgi:hypothetical protein